MIDKKQKILPFLSIGGTIAVIGYVLASKSSKTLVKDSCVADIDCSINLPFCKDNICVECNADQDCSNPDACLNSECKRINCSNLSCDVFAPNIVNSGNQFIVSFNFFNNELFRCVEDNVKAEVLNNITGEVFGSSNIFNLILESREFSNLYEINSIMPLDGNDVTFRVLVNNIVCNSRVILNN